MRGRKPKPTFLKLIDGNPGHRPINHDEPEPVGNLVDPPITFTAAQQKVWRETLANAPEGLFRKVDLGAVATYCVNLCEFLDATQKVAEMGSLVKTPGGQPMHNPYISIRNRAAAFVLKAGSELGLSPSSRSRVKVAGKKKAKNAFSKLKEFRI